MWVQTGGLRQTTDPKTGVASLSCSQATAVVAKLRCAILANPLSSLAHSTSKQEKVRSIGNVKASKSKGVEPETAGKPLPFREFSLCRAELISRLHIRKASRSVRRSVCASLRLHCAIVCNYLELLPDSGMSVPKV